MAFSERLSLASGTSICRSSHIAMALYSYGPTKLWPYIVMGYVVMALYSYGPI